MELLNLITQLLFDNSDALLAQIPLIASLTGQKLGGQARQGILGQAGGQAGQAGGIAGILGGGGGGAAAGLAGGPVGAAITAGLGVAQGIGSLISGGRAKRLEPPREDVEQRQFLNEIQRQRRGLRTGVAFRQTQRELRQQQAGAARGALRTGRGDLLARLTRQTQGALGEAAAREEQRGFQLTQLAGDLLGRISQRRLDLARTAQSKEEARAAGLRREAFGNVLGTAGQNVPVGEGQQPTGGGITEDTLKTIQGILGGTTS